jgi:hypothetical protein
VSLCELIEQMQLAELYGVSLHHRDERLNLHVPPDPVLRIASPPADSLPGTGDGAGLPFDTPTFLICARTWTSCLS